MKKGNIYFITVITFVFLLAGCQTSKTVTTKSGTTIPTTTYTGTTVPKIEPVTLTEFEEEGYYLIKPNHLTMQSSITFFDEINREILYINLVDNKIDLVKVPKYTKKIVLFNITLEKKEFSQDVYPTDQEIKDEEMGGTKPVYVLKEQLTSGRYYIRYRDYLEQEWTVELYKNNKRIRTYEFSNYKDVYVDGFMMWTNQDFDYARLYNCSLVYFAPLPI